MGEWFYVVDSLGRCISSFRKADLAERMLGSVGFSNCCPCFTVAFPCLRISLILLVASRLFLCMLLAEPSVSESRASREGARSFRFSGHFVFPIKKPCNRNGGRASNEKAPRELPQSLDSFISLLPISHLLSRLKFFSVLRREGGECAVQSSSFPLRFSPTAHQERTV